MESPGIQVLITAQARGEDWPRLLATRLAEDGHVVTPMPGAREGAFGGSLGGRTCAAFRTQADVAVLAPGERLLSAVLRARRVPTIPAPGERADIEQVIERIRRAAGLAERRSGSPQKSIVVAVPTYRRNAQLKALLPCLADHLREIEDLAPSSRIVVADNDPAEGARSVVVGYAATGSVPVTYVHADVPGVAAARNACLQAARSGELMVFIDDDQMPRPMWLRYLLLAWMRTGSGAVAGPTRPVYPPGTASWIEMGPFHDASHLPRDAKMTLSAVTNFLIDVDVVRRHGLSFPEIGTRGGEDSWFTTAMVKRGVVISWEPEAIVDEAVPLQRTTPSWVLTRSVGDGVITGRIGTRFDGSGPHLSDRIRQTRAGVLRVLGGGARILRGLGTRDEATYGLGLHTAFRGLGIALGAWDLVFDEYARPGVARWRVDRSWEG
ncbi:glycosyltransferase family 2 protein [Mobilicoccus pelagius]|uniref:Putative glycosyltransferase n=1 Tax=Mobilicoccus pelagius NBRC 104925 TaxID=1089455 RepID=H5USE5_9MICO|nr:glycosyltransferase [Mobilicoccus pelagius]GAB48653.1 putative glycosyltransferase [Mobilicoccus pelagius NBRC 104925]